MKRRHAAALPSGHLCQRPGCSNAGKPRSQSRKVKRTLYLCDECLERLFAHQLNDLFLQFAGEQNKMANLRQSDKSEKRTERQRRSDRPARDEKVPEPVR